MRNRSKYELRFPLIIWNVILASFSIMGTIRVLPDFIQILTNNGVVYSVCNNDFAYGITGFWSLMFILSKLPELVDTLFIVFRKQELIFLHWYHHTTVLVYCWFSYKDFASTGRWFMTMNYLVHSLMYSYYVLKAMRIKVPKFVSQLITTGQILQMIAGCYVNFIAYQTKVANEICNISDDNIKYSSLMYFSYFVLFFNFFINAYIFNKSKSCAVINKNSKNEVINLHKGSKKD
jgi:elongation of very long chain fatty acids protein 6